MQVDDGKRLSKKSLAGFSISPSKSVPKLGGPSYLFVQQVVQAKSSPLYIVDFAEDADDVCDLSSC